MKKHYLLKEALNQLERRIFIRFFKLFALFLIVSTVILLCGCTTKLQDNTDNPDDAPADVILIEGYIISIKNNKLLVVEKLSKEEADTSRYTENQILEKAKPNATWVSVTAPLNVKNYEVGDRIKVTIQGGVDTSFPEQAAAEKIDILS